MEAFTTVGGDSQSPIGGGTPEIRRLESPPPEDSADLSGRQSPRWPLSGQQAEFTSLPGGSSHAGVGRDLFGRLGRMGLHTMALTLVLFFAVPRFGQVAWRGPIAKPQTLVGFTDKVTLGELGKIIESRDAVMQVGSSSDDNDTPQPLNGDVYLQGAYLMLYKHGQWSAGQRQAAKRRHPRRCSENGRCRGRARPAEDHDRSVGSR